MRIELCQAILLRKHHCYCCGIICGTSTNLTDYRRRDRHTRTSNYVQKRVRKAFKIAFQMMSVATWTYKQDVNRDEVRICNTRHLDERQVYKRTICKENLVFLILFWDDHQRSMNVHIPSRRTVIWKSPEVNNH